MTDQANDLHTQGCSYCYRPASIGGHNNGCPIQLGTQEAMDEWKRGYTHGMRDNRIRSNEYRFYSQTFLLGNRVGLDDLEEGIQAYLESHW